MLVARLAAVSLAALVGVVGGCGDTKTGLAEFERINLVDTLHRSGGFELYLHRSGMAYARRIQPDSGRAGNHERRWLFQFSRDVMSELEAAIDSEDLLGISMAKLTGMAGERLHQIEICYSTHVWLTIRKWHSDENRGFDKLYARLLELTAVLESEGELVYDGPYEPQWTPEF